MNLYTLTAPSPTGVGTECRLHLSYAEMKNTVETLCAEYRSNIRIGLMDPKDVVSEFQHRIKE